MQYEGFQETLGFRVPIQKLSNNLYWEKVDIGQVSKFSMLFYDLGLILYLFRCSMKVFKRYYSSVSPFRSYRTICIGEKLILDGWVSSPCYFMILGSFFIYSDTVWTFSRDIGVLCPCSEVIKQSVVEEMRPWMDQWVLHLILWSLTHSLSIQVLFEGFQEIMVFHVPVQDLSNNFSMLEYRRELRVLKFT